MPFFEFADDPKQIPGEGAENASGDESGLFAHFDSTPLDDLVEGSGMVVKKSGTPKRKRAEKSDQPTPESAGLNELESEELLRAIVGPDVSQPGSNLPANEKDSGASEKPADVDLKAGGEDSPNVEPPAPSGGQGVFGLVKKMTSTLGIGRTVQGDSPSIGETPTLSADQKHKAGPLKHKSDKDDFERGEDPTGSPIARLGNLNEADEAPEKPSTTGALSKRKRKTSSLEITGMELDNPRPVEEADWIKTVTGVLLGKEESELQSTEEIESVSSRLGTLGEPQEEGPQALQQKEAAQSQPAAAEPEQPGWVSPFKNPLFAAEEKTPPADQPVVDQNAEFQAFLGKLQQEVQEKTPAPSTSKLDDDELLGALLREAPQGGEEDSSSLSRLSDLESEAGAEGPIDPAFWRIATHSLGKNKQETQPPVQMSPFNMDIDSWDGKTVKLTPPPSMSGSSVDNSAWDLPPEVQELLNQQNSGTSIQSPFDGSTMQVPVDQLSQTSPINPAFDFDQPIAPPDEGKPADQPLLALGMIEMPNFFGTGELPPPAADAYKPTAPLGEFDNKVFTASLEDAPAADAYRDTSRLDGQPRPSTRALDFLSDENKEAPAADAYRDTSRLEGQPKAGTRAFDFFSEEGEEAPAADIFRETKQLEGLPKGTTRAFEVFTTGTEESPAVEAFKETTPLMSNIEPPDPSFFFTAQPSTFEAPTTQPLARPVEEKTPATPLSRRIEPQAAPAGREDSDLRSMFTTAPPIAAEETAHVAAPVREVSPAVESAHVAAPVRQAEPAVESAPKPVAPPMSTRTKLLIAFGSLAAALTFVAIVVVGILIFRSNLVPLAPFAGQPNPQVSVSTVQVAPMGLELTGGWTFYLQKGDLKDGIWTPQGGSEWLNGTELRRIVALPWNPQLEAVTQTFKPGDPVRMLMNNNDIVVYRVDKVETVTRDQVDVLQGNTPALIVILYRNDSNERVVILAH